MRNSHGKTKIVYSKLIRNDHFDALYFRNTMLTQFQNFRELRSRAYVRLCYIYVRLPFNIKFKPVIEGENPGNF